MTQPFDMERAVILACETMAELAALMESETGAIEERRFDGLKELVERKEKLTHNLEVLFAGIRRDKPRFQEFTQHRPDLRDRLQQGWNRLDTLAARNMEVVGRARAATKSVVDILVREARRSHQSQAGYANAYGKAGGRRAGAHAASALSIAIDTTL